MNADHIRTIVERELANFRYETGAGAFGRPWSAGRVTDGIATLRDSRLEPEPTTIRGHPNALAESAGWIVARAAHELLVVYDPRSNEFALAEPDGARSVRDIGVRGDLIGTFLAA
jgi:hypothetical protein